jgi:aldose 1-epimerase
MEQPTISSEPCELEGVSRYTLANDNQMVVKIFNYGGIIQSISFPDRDARPANVVLGFASLADYLTYNPAPHPGQARGAGVYFGALIGRYANRIARGELTIAGRRITVPVNNGPNALHGGTRGFDQVTWTAVTSSDAGSVSLALSYVSEEGEMGFPGALHTRAIYSLDNENRLTLSFTATTTAETVVNLTNHTYWNLAGESSGSVYDQVLQINADGFTPVDETLIPNGTIEPVAGTPFDFTPAKAIGEHIRGGPGFAAVDNEQLVRCQGYDHNLVLNQTSPASLVLAARAFDPSSGRALRVFTTQPAIQLYSGNFLNGALVGTGGRAYRQSDGFALETQHFPDSPNNPAFPPTGLSPGENFTETTVYQLSNSDLSY